MLPARIPVAADSHLRPRPHARVCENLEGLEPPVIFASNHQSYMDVPAILSALPARWRYRVAPAMRKEFFEQHFHGRSFTNSLNYYLSTLFFNCFPIPQREPGALATLRYMGELANDKWCVLIFPEGRMSERRRNRAVPARRRDDRVETGNPGGSDPHRRHGSGAAPELEDGENGQRPNRVRPAAAFSGHRLSGAGPQVEAAVRKL